MKSIIIEGFDGCGKSTLAKQLGRFYNLGIHVIGGKPKSNDIAKEMSWYQCLIAKHSLAIFDRVTCISRLCYELDMNELHRAMLLRDLSYLESSCIFIWTTVPNEVHEIKEYDTDEHIKHITENRDIIKANYHSVMTSIDHIHYDYTDMPMDDLLNEINMRVQE